MNGLVHAFFDLDFPRDGRVQIYRCAVPALECALRTHVKSSHAGIVIAKTEACMRVGTTFAFIVADVSALPNKAQ